MSLNKNPTCRIMTIAQEFCEWYHEYQNSTVRNLDQFDMEEAFIAGYKQSRKDFAELRADLASAEAAAYKRGMMRAAEIAETLPKWGDWEMEMTDFDMIAERIREIAEKP